MTDPLGGTETQSLGHTASLPPTMPPGGYQQSAPRKSGCGCGCGCFTGCLVILLLIAGFFAVVYFFGFKNDRYIGHIDRVVVWTYESTIRPKLADTFTTGMPDQERARFLQMSDRAVERYLALPPEQKKAMLSEAAVAFWYLQNGQLLPPEKIPNLKAFVESLEAENRGGAMRRSFPSAPPAVPPAQRLQEPPRRPIAPAKDSPRLLN